MQILCARFKDSNRITLYFFSLFKSVLVYLWFKMYVFIGITRHRDSHCSAMELHFDCVLWLEFIVHTYTHTFTVPLNQRLKAYETVTLYNYETKVIINRRINNRSNNNSKKKKLVRCVLVDFLAFVLWLWQKLSFKFKFQWAVNYCAVAKCFYFMP